MRFEIRGRPKFQFTLTMTQIRILMDRSSRHYDSVCRAASDPIRPDHFIHTWQVCMKSVKTDYVHSATWRELDITLKILEYPPAGIPERERNEQKKLRCSIWDAMNAAQEAMKSWKLDVNL